MELELLAADFAVCRLSDCGGIDFTKPFTFFAKTDLEISYVCPQEEIPPNATAVSEGWRGLRVAGVLDFSMIGVLAQISVALAKAKISIFVVSTYDTDYIFFKAGDLERAVACLKDEGYQFS